MKKYFSIISFNTIILLCFSKVVAQDFWQSASGPSNMSIYSIVVNSKGHIFAATMDGLYSSTNNGTNWQLTKLVDWINSLAISSNDIIYAGTDTTGVCRSTDDGVNWNSVSSTDDFVLHVSVANNGDIYYTTWYGRLYKSTNNGTDWELFSSIKDSSSIISFVRNINGYLFDGTYIYGGYRYDGQSWLNLLNRGLIDSTVWVFCINNSGHIFAGTNHGVYRSINNGDSWQSISNGLPEGDVTALTINENGSIFAGCFGSGVYRSIDNGETWEQINSGLSNFYIRSFFIDHAGYLWAGTQGIVFRSRSTTVVPTTININTNVSFGDASKQTSYQMFGLPGNHDLPLSQVLSGSADKDWTAYWDNGEQGNTYLVKNDGTNTFNFKPGRAFWILSKNSISVNRSVNAVTLTNNNFSITLHSGWNLISNPFNKNIIWNDVKLLNGITQPIHNFNNSSYTQPTTFEPYKGYYFLNDLNLQTLKIPYGPGLMPYIPTSSNLEKQTTIKSLRLTLKSDDEREEFVEVMFNNNSAEGKDELDIFAPPNNFLEKSITIFNDKLSNSYKYLMVDSRKEIGEGQAYDLIIKNKLDGSTFIKSDGIEHFSNYEIYLVDNNLNKFYNLKKSQQLNLSIFHKDYSFRLLIGNEAFIWNKQTELKPTRFELYQNYPNPFNPFTTLKYSLPVESEVKISLYNLLGETVEVLSNKTQSIGYHEFNFDGSKLSSGIYYYNISAKSLDGKNIFNKVRKMILLK